MQSLYLRPTQRPSDLCSSRVLIQSSSWIKPTILLPSPRFSRQINSSKRMKKSKAIKSFNNCSTIAHYQSSTRLRETMPVVRVRTSLQEDKMVDLLSPAKVRVTSRASTVSRIPRTSWTILLVSNKSCNSYQAASIKTRSSSLNLKWMQVARITLTTKIRSEHPCSSHHFKIDNRLWTPLIGASHNEEGCEFPPCK